MPKQALPLAMNVRHASLLGIAASISSALGLFVAFRVSIGSLGAETVGAWVLIQSLFFLSRIAEGGVGINLTRTFVVDRSTTAALSPRPYFIAGLLLVVGPVIGIGVALIVPAQMLLLGYFDTGLESRVVFQLILLCYLNAVLSAISSVGMAVVEGQGKLVWRHIASIVSSVVFAAGAYPAVSSFDVIGLAALYVAATMASLVFMSVLLWRSWHDGHTGRSRRAIMGSVWGDSLTATGMILLRISFEPWSKFLVGSFGGLAAVAALELAFRITTQFRVLIQSATQPLLSIGARTEAAMSDRAYKTYETANSLVVQANWASLALVCSAAPVISFLGFGYVSSQAILFLIILGVGNSINSMGVIGYYAEASRGGMRRLFSIHVEMMVINVLAGTVCGWAFGAIGAVMAYAFGFAYGGVALLHIWADATHTNIVKLVISGRMSVAIACLSLAVSALATAVLSPSWELVVVGVLMTGVVVSALAKQFIKQARQYIWMTG